MVYKEEVLLWFNGMQAAQRIEFLCGLIHLCMPTELRYLASCLEGLAKKDYIALRDSELKANNCNHIQQLQGIVGDEVRARLSVGIALLHCSNVQCANCVYHILMLNAEMARHLVLTGDERAKQETFLIYTMACNHPAFTFEQRNHLYAMLKRLYDTVEMHLVHNQQNANNSCIVQRFPTASTFIHDIRVVGAERCFEDTSRLWFSLEVGWSDYMTSAVKRTSADLHRLHYRIESYLSNQTNRGFTHVHLPPLLINEDMEVEQAIQYLADYFRRLLALSTYVSSCPVVIDFFKAIDNDRVHESCTVRSRGVQTEIYHPSNYSASSSPIDTPLSDIGDVSSQEGETIETLALQKRALSKPINGVRHQRNAISLASLPNSHCLSGPNNVHQARTMTNNRHVYAMSGKPETSQDLVKVNMVPIPSPRIAVAKVTESEVDASEAPVVCASSPPLTAPDESSGSSETTPVDRSELLRKFSLEQFENRLSRYSMEELMRVEGPALLQDDLSPEAVYRMGQLQQALHQGHITLAPVEAPTTPLTIEGSPPEPIDNHVTVPPVQPSPQPSPVSVEDGVLPTAHPSVGSLIPYPLGICLGPNAPPPHMGFLPMPPHHVGLSVVEDGAAPGPRGSGMMMRPTSHHPPNCTYGHGQRQQAIPPNVSMAWPVTSASASFHIPAFTGLPLPFVAPPPMPSGPGHILPRGPPHTAYMHGQRHFPTNGHGGAVLTHFSYPPPYMPPMPPRGRRMSCSNCGQLGHKANHCPEKTMDQALTDGVFRMNLNPTNNNGHNSSE